MKVLGIDPGSNITGYGVVEEKGDRLSVLDRGIIIANTKKTLPERLKLINEGIEKIIIKHMPDAVAVEDLFFAKNVKSVLKLGHARGVIILTAAKQNIFISEYTPLEIKQSIVGYGRADKNQVKTMVSFILNLGNSIQSTDESDALAVAVCHLHSVRLKNKLQL